jgi:hypothetical protein
MPRLVLLHDGEEGMWHNRSQSFLNLFAHGGRIGEYVFTPLTDAEKPMQVYYRTQDGTPCNRDTPGAVRHAYCIEDLLFVDLPDANPDRKAMLDAVYAHLGKDGLPNGRRFTTWTVEALAEWRNDLLND